MESIMKRIINNKGNNLESSNSIQKENIDIIMLQDPVLFMKIQKGCDIKSANIYLLNGLVLRTFIGLYVIKTILVTKEQVLDDLKNWEHISLEDFNGNSTIKTETGLKFNDAFYTGKKFILDLRFDC